MQYIIDGKVYDTKKMTEVLDYGGTTLYLTKKGNWFYFTVHGDNRVITADEACEKLVECDAVDAVNKYFPGTIEDG